MTTGVLETQWSSTHLDGAVNTTGNCRLREVLHQLVYQREIILCGVKDLAPVSGFLLCV